MMGESSVNWAIEHHHIHLLPVSAKPSASSSLLRVGHTDEEVGRSMGKNTLRWQRWVIVLNFMGNFGTYERTKPWNPCSLYY
jgi:hypothetical protein